MKTSGTNGLFIMEPITKSGTISFSDYKRGDFDGALKELFLTIKASGISSDAIGMWAYFPEGNTPEWQNSSPTDFIACVSRSVQIQKNIFPGSLASILLDSQTYSSNDQSWADGQYRSLLPYVSGLAPGLIDSFGYQGFPWAAPADTQQADSLEPSQFLPIRFAYEAALALGVKTIWLNSGTFSRMFTDNPHQTRYLSTQQRSAILNGIYSQAQALKSAGFAVGVNIFAENKSNAAEATDWSYDSPAAGQVLSDFQRRLQNAGIAFWLFR